MILVVLLSSFISADIIFTSPEKLVYNLGDVINVPVRIETSADVAGSLNMDLICNGAAINFYKDGVNLVAGAEKKFNSSLVLVDKIIGGKRGICKIKIMLNGDYVLSNEFKISDSLSITGNLQKTEFSPKEFALITGKVTKENEENLNGFIEASIETSNTNGNITQFGIVTNGIFSLNISLPDNLKGGNYLVKIKAFEKDSDGAITNKGFADYNIFIKQVPTNLELILENKDISPGTNVKIKMVLHDQTGDSINSVGFITIKNSKNKIIEQKEIQTGEFLEYFIKNSEPSAEWQVFAISNKLTAEDKFNIGVKEDVSVEIVNKTILVTNIGNVVYDKTLLVKIGDDSLDIPVLLDIGESKKYTLSAPDGEYSVEVISGEGNNNAKGIMSLTGGVINMREISNSALGTSLWILLILILGIVVFVTFRKIYKKPFFGKQHMNFKKKDREELPVLKDNKVTRTVNKAEISLSIKGEKQDASVICLRIRNLGEMKSRKGSAKESIEKIRDIAEENKAVIYENQDYLFFIFAPTKTRTFKNEKMTLGVAESIHKILTEHNKMFNQKMDFGISLNQGTIVAKIEDDIFKFMSMGNLITAAKKIASLAKEEVLIGEKMNDLLRLNIRTEKSIRNGFPVFSIKEIKKENEEARKFIERFLNRQGKE